MRIMTADGEIDTASPTENTALFKHALGGYGLFRIILEAELDVVSHAVYQWSKTYIDYKDIAKFYKYHIIPNENVKLVYARLSVSPFNYLRETAVHTIKQLTSMLKYLRNL